MKLGQTFAEGLHDFLELITTFEPITDPSISQIKKKKKVVKLQKLIKNTDPATLKDIKYQFL